MRSAAAERGQRGQGSYQSLAVERHAETSLLSPAAKMIGRFG
jgi:hypothetical protein